MKFIILLLFTFHFLLLPCPAQWVFQQSGTTQPLYDIFFIDKNTGWVSGNNSTILKTTNGGVNWFPQFANTYTGKSLYGIYFVNHDVGYIAGWAQTILKTTNGGDNWIKLRDGLIAQGNSFNDVWFLNEDTGWIGGFVGNVQKTTDGGLTWDSIWIGITAEVIRELEFVNENTGYVCGDGGLFFKSTNGGYNWTRYDLGIFSNLSMYFINAETGWCVGEQSNKVFRTTNGGVNWILLDSLPGGNLQYSYCIKFINSFTGWIGGTYGRLFRTNDGGINWFAEDYDILGFVNNFSSYKDSLIWCAGGGGKIKMRDIYRRGQNQSGWISQTTNTPTLLKDIYMLNDTVGWTVGFNDTIFHTTNSGNNWVGISTLGKYGSLSCHFVNSATGWVLVEPIEPSSGCVLKTTNTGYNWFSQLCNGSWIRAVYFISPYIGWIACDFGMVYRTTNSGLNWLASQFSGTWYLNGVFFITSTKGWVCGADGRIGLSEDGGQSWAAQNSGTNTDLNSIFFADENTGYCVGGRYYGGIILKTLDGGNNWFTQQNTSYKLNSVCFASADTGWVAGDFGTILFTTNGGSNWLPQVTGNFNNFYSVHFSSKRTGWICGGYGIILKTTTGGEIIGITNNQHEIPERYNLSQNYPNPFNPVTVISYQLPKDGDVKLIVYDVLGREVVKLVDSKQQIGTYEIVFDGSQLTTGVYFYTLHADKIRLTRKMILLK